MGRSFLWLVVFPISLLETVSAMTPQQIAANQQEAVSQTREVAATALQTLKRLAAGERYASLAPSQH